MTWIVPGCLPIINFASSPTATTFPSLSVNATTAGSSRIIPRLDSNTSTLAVPKSIPIRFENISPPCTHNI